MPLVLLMAAAALMEGLARLAALGRRPRWHAPSPGWRSDAAGWIAAQTPPVDGGFMAVRPLQRIG